jgi:hypothetical protein
VIPLNTDELEYPYEKTIVHDSSTFELISTKVQKDGESFCLFVNRKALHLVYAQVEGPGLASSNVKDWLESKADFGSLSKRKAMAKLPRTVSKSCPEIQDRTSQGYP